MIMEIYANTLLAPKSTTSIALSPFLKYSPRSLIKLGQHT